MFEDTASALFGVDGLQVTGVEAVPDGGIEVWVVTACADAAACPECGTVSDQVHETVVTRPRDVRRAGDVVNLRWVKVRRKCESQQCPRKTFTESVPALPPRCRITARLLADRWHTCFFDLDGGQGLLGQVQGRTADDAACWLACATPARRDAVRVVCIDLCSIYASAVRRMLPRAILTGDLFHTVQPAGAARCHDV